MKRTPSIYLLALTTVLLASCCLTGCTSGPDLMFADWLIPVPEGTPVKEYGPVPVDERDPGAIELVDDLVIGTDLSNPAAVLFEPRAVVAAPDGTIFVADGGTSDIKMFDADGAYMKTLGQEGQGPGEFAFITAMTLAGDMLVVNDSRNRRFSVWTLDGKHVADYAPTERRSLVFMQGLADGTVTGYFTERDEDRNGTRVVARQNVQGEVVSHILEIPLPPPEAISSRDPHAILQSALDSFDDPRINLAAGSGEVIYVTPVHEYQLYAYSPQGEMLWALRTAWERFDWPASAKDSMMSSFARSFETEEELRAEDFTWPEKYTALAGVNTDGHGRLFAIIAPMPNADSDGTRPPSEYPVDAYSADGERLAAGVVPYVWSFAVGDYVYGIRPDDNEEMVVVRYRLLVNGQ
ncbi:MAG: 6-bladed beta-propeller [Acidobacteriota bacterium]|jgi:hypothetical protein